MNILMTGNLFYDYELEIADAFRNLGHNVDVDFINFEGPFRGVKKFRQWLTYGFFPYQLGVQSFKENAFKKHNQRLLNKIENIKYDFYLVVKGRSVSEDVLSSMGHNSVMWVLDSIIRFDELYNKIDLVGKTYSFEPSDVKLCKKKWHKDISFLPVGFSPKQYLPLNEKNRYQVSFVGANKPEREMVLNQLLLNNVDLALVGDYNNSKNKLIKEKLIAKSLDHRSINTLYCQSMFNLNIHKNQSQEGANPRFFEILGSRGGAQLVEEKEYILSNFDSEKDIITYTSNDELVDKIRYYQQNTQYLHKIAESGYERVISGHTWEHRVSQLLDDIQL